jgi:lipopolysaccharide export system ATP-binding protein
MSGGGEGATYDQKQDILALLDRAHVVMAADEQGSGALDATSHVITLVRPAHVVRLDRDARIVRDGNALTADNAVVHMTDDESRLTRIELRGQARVAPGPGKGASGPPDMRADDIDLDLHDDGQTIRNAVLTGKGGAAASVDMTGDDGAHRLITGSRINLTLGRDGETLTLLDAARPVSVTLPKTADAEARRIDAETLHAIGKEPGGLTGAVFDGHPVKFVEDVPKSGAVQVSQRTVTSQQLALKLKGQLDAIDFATFTGEVDLKDANGTAHADRAEYDATDKAHRMMRLYPTDATRPLPWAENKDRRHVEARTIDLFLDSASNDLNADGRVVTQAPASSPAAGHAASPLFGGDKPIFGSAESLKYRGNQATYVGLPGAPARVWQDRSLVKGDEVVFESDTNNLRARGHVESDMPADRTTSTGSKGGASSIYQVRNATSLDYDDGRRVAHFEGKPVKLHGEDGDTSARTVDLMFAPDSSAVQRMVWDGDVRADLNDRRKGVGSRLTYDADTDRYVLTGKAEALFPNTGDAFCTLSLGDELMFERKSGAAQGATFTDSKVPCTETLPYKKKDEGMATLRTEGLTKSYGGRTVVRDINLDLSSGEIVGLLGPNGAGKTTTFSMVVGLTGADAGQVLLDDRRVTSDPMYVRARKGIGYLPQEPSIFRGLTVEQNVLAILETQPIGRAERRRRLAELLGELNLTPLAKARAHTLSGGERRRVEITRALVSQPKFMLLDEPFAGIDPIAVGDIQKIIFHLRDRGIGVLITDHNVRETLKITDRAYIVHDGAIFKSGTPARLAADEEVKRIYLGADFRLD